MDELTIGYALRYQMLPAAMAIGVAAGLWLAVCRYIHRVVDRRHHEAIRLESGCERRSLEEGIAAVTVQRKLAGQGSPSDRMFFFGLATAAIAACACLALFHFGVTPAGASERQFIRMVQQSEFAQRPQVAIALSAAADSVYISRQHFLAVEESLNMASVSTR